MTSISIFASGNASNAKNILKYFKDKHPENIKFCCLVTNNPKSGLVALSLQYAIPLVVFDNKEFQDGDKLLQCLHYFQPNYIILAGFLRKIPKEVIQNYPNRIINIHPSLLPKFGGKGMYGLNVHQAVLQANEKMSGFTVHFVNPNYDEGEIIEQLTVVIQNEETPASLQEKIKQHEHLYFPKILERMFHKDLRSI